MTPDQIETVDHIVAVAQMWEHNAAVLQAIDLRNRAIQILLRGLADGETEEDLDDLGVLDLELNKLRARAMTAKSEALGEIERHCRDLDERTVQEVVHHVKSRVSPRAARAVQRAIASEARS